MQFNDLLTSHGIDPKYVLVLRHRPKEPELRKFLPWLANERPDVFNAYQQTQTPRVENAMQRAKFVASFIGHAPSKALFVALYQVGKSKPLSYKQYWSLPVNVQLRDLGHIGMTHDRKMTLWFDLDILNFKAEWKGKLIVHWPGKELSWWRWSAQNEFGIQSILETSILDPAMPEWTQLAISWRDLGVLPQQWCSKLSQWRGIYFILDVTDGKGYVGAAYGHENILGRWRNYARSGHGGNKQLREREPEKLRFSILQHVSPDMESSAVQALEASWKDRLHTREFGLNEN